METKSQTGIIQWWIAYCSTQLEQGETIMEASTRLIVADAWTRSDQDRLLLMRLLHCPPSSTKAMRLLRKWVPGVVRSYRRRGPSQSKY